MNSITADQFRSNHFPLMNNPTASLPVVNNNASSNDPTDRQDQSPPRKKSRIDTSSTDPRHRGRGFTGGPRGRPVGAKNKPKGPEDDQPKLPKKRGRPVGAKNKAPRRALTPKPPAPTVDRSPLDGGIPQPPPPEAQQPFVLHPNVFPEALRTYRTPDEYIPYGYEPAERTLPAKHPRPDDLFTTIFSDPPASPSPYNTPRSFEDVEPAPDFGNFFPSSMSPEENNNFAIDPALLDNRYNPNGLDIFNNSNNTSSGSFDDFEARTRSALQLARSQDWYEPLCKLNNNEEVDPFAI
ncbi:hypothetical protein BDR22DRAFT_571991 [Usnea florida]